MRKQWEGESSSLLPALPLLPPWASAGTAELGQFRHHCFYCPLQGLPWGMFETGPARWWCSRQSLRRVLEAKARDPDWIPDSVILDE